MSRIYGYLRASTKDQDAHRAKTSLESFASENNQTVSAWFIEHESGAVLKRPELFRLLDIAQRGDVLLVEHLTDYWGNPHLESEWRRHWKTSLDTVLGSLDVHRKS